jgi:cellulose synthase (UDP-forming)
VPRTDLKLRLVYNMGIEPAAMRRARKSVSESGQNAYFVLFWPVAINPKTVPKKLLILTIVLNLAYIAWLPFHVDGALGATLVVAEFFLASLSLSIGFNHWSQKHGTHPTAAHDAPVDVLITVVDEPLEMLESTVRSALKIDHPTLTVYVLDDGGRDEVAALCSRTGAKYLSRPDSPKDYKAGNLNFGLANSKSPFILTLDADQRVTDPRILTELLGHFAADKGLAMIATRQKFNVPHADFNHDELFYEHMQTGKNEDNAAISSGSGVIYSRAALAKIGGFPTWNVVEDLYTAYTLHQHGFVTLYVNKAYTYGTAPMDLASIFKQRGTWALDTLRLFFRQNPWFKRTLTFRQKLHYSELAMAYLVSAFAITTLFVLPILSVWTRTSIVDAPEQYLLFRIPSLIVLLYFYYRVSGNTFSTCQFWAALFPAYLKATLLALLPGKPKYRVTPKVGTGKRDTILALPHFALIVAAIYVALEYATNVGVDSFLAVNCIWFALMAFWCYPLMRKAVILE